MAVRLGEVFARGRLVAHVFLQHRLGGVCCGRQFGERRLHRLFAYALLFEFEGDQPRPLAAGGKARILAAVFGVVYKAVAAQLFQHMVAHGGNIPLFGEVVAHLLFRLHGGGEVFERFIQRLRFFAFQLDLVQPRKFDVLPHAQAAAHRRLQPQAAVKPAVYIDVAALLVFQLRGDGSDLRHVRLLWRCMPRIVLCKPINSASMRKIPPQAVRNFVFREQP